MSATKNTIERSLYYYDLELYKKDVDNDDNLKEVPNFETVIRDVFTRIQKAGFSDDIKVTLDTGNQLFFIVDEIEKNYINYKMVLVRVGALPFIEKEGILESLAEILDENQNIAEITHCVLFPEDKVVGIEFNFSGARSSALAAYIQSIRDDIDLLTCRPKVNAEVFEKIDSKEGLTLFDLAIKTDSEAFSKVLSKKSVFAVLRKEVGDADTVEIVLKKKKNKDNTNKFSPILSNEEMKSLVLNHKDDVKKFAISQGTITTDKIDLLSDKYVKKAMFKQKNGRVVDSNQVYEELRRFYTLSIKEK